VFPVKTQPAFEVVEDAPAQKPAPSARKPAPKAEDPDFEVIDDDDDKPKKKTKSADDGKTKVVVVFVDGDDDDDDDDDGGSRKKRKKKKKRRRDDDDDDWYPQGGGGGGAFGKGRTASLLMSISFWLNLGAFGILALYMLIGWVAGNSLSSSSSSPRSSRGGGDGDGSIMDIIVILPGLVGLGAWIVGLVGTAFAIAGPAKARGMAITSTVFASIHLVLAGVTFSNMQEGLGSVGRSLPGVGKIAWVFIASTLPAINSFLPMLFYQSRLINGEYIITFLAAVCEALRLVFMLMTLKAMAEAAKDYDAAEKSHFSLMTALLILGGVLIGTLLMVVLLAEGGFKSIKTVMNLLLGTVFLMYLAYTFMMVGPALAGLQTKDACNRRS
jgi:hypothetical protein